LKQRQITDGKVQRVDEVDRGGLLVYEKDEWMRRALPEQRRHERVYLFQMLSWFCLALFEIVLFVILSDPVQTGRLPIVFMWLILSGLYAVHYFIIAGGNRNPIAVPGIYENGIQLLHHTFVPFKEIGRVERKEGRFMTWKKRDLVHLHPKVEPDSKYSTGAWRLPVDFLGPGGMACLKERMEISRGLKVGVPELVLYGPGGSKTVSRGVGPVNGRW
jgi:hypothetical protein